MKKKFIGVIGIVIAVMVGGIYYLTRAEKMELSLKNKKEIIVEYGNTVQYSFDDLIQTKDIDKDKLKEIKKETINRLKESRIIVKIMPKIEAPQEIKSKNKLFPHWNNTFDKFNIFNLTEYDKVVYLDSDIYVSENIDELFEKPNMSAVIAGKSYPFNKHWNELNSGVMVIEPKEGIREELINRMYEMSKIKRALRKPHKQEYKRFFSNISLLKIKDKICKYVQGIGDQDVLEDFFDWKNNPQLHLDEQYNVFSNYADYYKKDLGINPKCYHFIGAKKPWSLTPKELAKQRTSLESKKDIQKKAFEEYTQIIYDNADKTKINFSIIIPMRNAKQYIEKALSSIKSQNYENIEILIIDDDSSDSSKQCVEEFCKKNSDISDKIKILETEEGHRGIFIPPSHERDERYFQKCVSI